MKRAAHSPVPSPPLPSSLLPTWRAKRYVDLFPASDPLADFCRYHMRHAQGCQTRESGCQHDADIPNIDGQAHGMEEVVDYPGCHHQAWVDGPADDPPEGVPGSVVEPVPKFLRSSEIAPFQ
jgi:hypothetical protein